MDSTYDILMTKNMFVMQLLSESAYASPYR